MATENGADITFKAFGTETNVKNFKSLNTGLTAAALAGVVFIGYLVFAHAGDQKAAGAAIVQAIREVNAEDAKKISESNNNLASALRELSNSAKEQTRATREQNCLSIFDQNERQRQAENCKRLSQ